MPTAVTNLPLTADPPRKRWSRAEYKELSAGALGNDHVELVEGELISKMGKNRPHVTALVMLQGWLIQVFGFRFVQPEAPIDVAPEDNPSNEPEPDIIVTRRDVFKFAKSNPRPEELALVVEVSDSRLDFDLATKSRLYARAGITDYWVVDVRAQRIIVHRDPIGGAYASVQAYSKDESVAPLAAPAHQLVIAELFEP